MVGPKRWGCLIARAVNDALASVRAGYFGQPAANPLLCFRITNTALAVEQDEVPRLRRVVHSQNCALALRRRGFSVVNKKNFFKLSMPTATAFLTHVCIRSERAAMHDCCRWRCRNLAPRTAH